MAGRRNRRHSTPCLLHASCSGTLISNSDPKLHSYKFFYPMILNPNSPRSCRFFNSLRTRTISETLSNTRPWCCLSSEPRGFRLTNTTISVTFHIYFLPKCSSKHWFNSIWWSNFWFGRLTFHFMVDFIDMRAFDELRKLEMFFKDESRHGVSIVDLYELVQHAGNILPRL